MSEQHPPAGPDPDPTTPVTGPPWSTHSGDSIRGAAPDPRPSYQSGHAQVPPARPQRDYPPTSEFPVIDPATAYGPPPGYGVGPTYDSRGAYEPAGYSGYPPAPPQVPPGYRKGPPPPPPRPPGRISAVAVVLIVAVLLCGGLVIGGLLLGRNSHKASGTTAAPSAKAPTTTVAPSPSSDGGFGQELSVTYQVTGEGSAEVVYLEKRDGQATHARVDLPWQVTLKVRTPVVLNVTAVRASVENGSLTCREIVNGQTVKESTSHTGHFTTVTCNYVAVD